MGGLSPQEHVLWTYTGEVKTKAYIVQSRIGGLAAGARFWFQIFEFKFHNTYNYEL